MNGLAPDHARNIEVDQYAKRIVEQPAPRLDPRRVLVGYLIARVVNWATFWLVFVVTVGGMSIYAYAHRGDKVAQDVPPASIQPGTVTGSPCGPYGHVIEAWLDNNDGPYPIYDVRCSDQPTMILMVPQP